MTNTPPPAAPDRDRLTPEREAGKMTFAEAKRIAALDDSLMNHVREADPLSLAADFILAFADLDTMRADERTRQKAMRVAVANELALQDQLDALRAERDRDKADTRRLDWLAYDGEEGPVFDALGEHDVHEAACADWDGEGDARPHYLRGFRAVIDAAIAAALPGGTDHG